MVQLETSRCVLRHLEAADAADMFRLDSDPLVMKYLGQSLIKNVAESRKIIEMVQDQYLANGYGRWAVALKDGGTFVGWAGLKLVTGETYFPDTHTDLGYRLLPLFWGKGYASELALACRDWAFTHLNVPALYAATHQENVASQKVIQKIGLTLEGTFDYHSAPQYWYKLAFERWQTLDKT